MKPDNLCQDGSGDNINLIKQREKLAYLILAGPFFIVFGFSYFGKLNPHPLGLMSALMVSLIGMSGAYLFAFFGRIYITVYLLLVVVMVFLNTISNWAFYQYFEALYNYQVLSYRGDILSPLKFIESFEYRNEALALGMALVGSVIASIAVYNKNIFQKRNSTVIAGLLFLLSIGTLCIVEVSLAQYKKLNISVLKPSYLHPVHAFFHGDEIKNQKAEEEESHKLFKSFNKYLQPSQYSFEENKYYNVIFLYLESFRASLVGAYGNSEGLTPNFDRLSSQMIMAKNFYGNSNYTIKSEVAAWCGIFDNNASPPMSKSTDKIINLNCLPKILRSRGYETLYLHGNTGKFNSRYDFLPKVGFDKLQFPEDEDIHADAPRIGWGIADTYLIDYFFDGSLQEIVGRPFLAHIMTVSSHYPYAWNWGIESPLPTFQEPSNPSEIYNNYKNAINYEDYILGYFWEKFKQSSIFQNTILVVTGDHGIWSFDTDQKSTLQKNEEFFRLPLLIYHPDVEDGLVIDQVSSQIDLPLTVLNMLGINEYDSQFVGKDILSPVIDPWAIMMKQGEVVTRVGNEICFIENDNCSGIQQDCVAIDYGEIFPNISKKLACREVHGDLLVGEEAEIKNVKADNTFRNEAYNLIRFHNKSVFSGRSTAK